MKRVYKADLAAGMVLAEPIMDDKHSVLLEANVRLKQSNVDTLKTWDIEFIRVREDHDTDESLAEQLKLDRQTFGDITVVVNEEKAPEFNVLAMTSEQIKNELGITQDNIRAILMGGFDSKLYSSGVACNVQNQAVKITSLVDEKKLGDYASLLKDLDKVFFGDKRERQLFLRDCNDFAKKVENFVLNTVGVIGYSFYPYKDTSNPLVKHTLRTTILAAKLAQLMRYTQKDILVVVLGSLLHDIGCTLLPDNMQKFNRRLSPDEKALYQKHVLTGVNLVKDQRFLPREVLLIIGSHHELLDGTGYPLRLTAEKIPNLVRVVALANAVDTAMFPMTPEKEAISLPQVLEQLPYWAGKYDKKMCEVLAVYLEDFILSNRVTLDDGRLAEIIWSHKSYKEPVIRTSDGEIIDLNKAAGVNIEGYSI